MARPIRIEWDKIKQEYRRGIKSMARIAADHQCSEASVRRMVKIHKWKKDLKPKINKEIKKRLKKKKKKARVKKKKARYTVSDPQVTPEREAEIVEAAANRAVMVVQAHRGDLMQMRVVMNNMLQELALMSQCPQELAESIDIITHNSELTNTQADYARTRLLKILDLPMRTTSLRNLAKTLALLIPLERQAFGLNEDTPPPEEDYTPMEERIRAHARALEHHTGPPELKIVNRSE